MKNKHLKLVVNNTAVKPLSYEELNKMFSFVMKSYDSFYTFTFNERIDAIVMARYLSENGYNVSIVQREVGNKSFFYLYK